METIRLEKEAILPEREEKGLDFSSLLKKLKSLFVGDFESGKSIGRLGDSLKERKKRGFILEDRLKSVKGPFIEIGGPTIYGYDLIEFGELDKKVFASNLFPGCPIITKGENGDENLNYYGKVDFIADGRELPLKDNSVGAIFASSVANSKFKELSTGLGKKDFPATL